MFNTTNNEIRQQNSDEKVEVIKLFNIIPVFKSIQKNGEIKGYFLGIPYSSCKNKNGCLITKTFFCMLKKKQFDIYTIYYFLGFQCFSKQKSKFDILFDKVSKLDLDNETILLTQGRILANQQYNIKSENFNDYEFKIFSQFGDDGLIQYLVKNLNIKNKFFVEFGVSDYLESNTRFLLMNNNWSGFVMDGSEKNMNALKNQSWYWKYDIDCKAVFIDKDNINGILKNLNQSDIGLLHIDLDGNDYHILNELDLSKLNPTILILEYNSIFGKDRAITVPYDAKFYRTDNHYSNLYYGASLKALTLLADKKGYALIGSNIAANNAYFIKKECLNDKISQKSVDEVFVNSKLREARDTQGKLSYTSGEKRLELIKGLPVLNVETNSEEKI